ncbi:nuclear transport factor 2 family protein [Amnibacterium kyonggiense]|uniref:Putative SnoaL-like aldol condensation-catalyzing enzyme n=1 Tax=Amnibacterium kyonggiense TaxID=595671 RepID=A0A4R7FSK6_9MICO|nr:nuclear transport factor 2 family protein [Amnibacterium kyonggiense]TDS80786.1 putative SnoaL-like aldol condensation-catalyzing enzyme [Amnibacterium kyonggiense]
MTSATTVTTALHRLFGDRDPGVIDDLFGPVYRQHSALGVDGLAGVRALLDHLPPGFGYELLRVVADGDLVVTHGLYRGYGPAPVVGFDVWRVRNGRIVEHWDALGPLGGAGPDDRAPVEGPTAPAELEQSDANRALVREWAEVVLRDGAGAAARFVGDASVDHARGGAPVDRPRGADGTPIRYRVVHQVIAEGDLVFTRSEGGDAAPLIVNDLWRVEGGRIVEHWGLVVPVPATLPHDNGAF